MKNGTPRVKGPEKSLADLVEREDYFKALIENSADGIILIDPRGRIRYASPSSNAITGFKKGERIGTSFRDIISPDQRNVVDAEFSRLLSRPGETVHIEVAINDSNGERRILAVTGRNLTQNPIVGGIVVNFRDITARKDAEEKLRESELKYRQLVEQASEAILIVDPNGKTLLANKRGNELFGFVDGGMIGIPVAETYIDEERASAPLNLQKITEGGVHRFERLVRRKDGTVIPVDVSVTVLGDGNLQGIFRDISDRKKAETKLRISERKYRSLFENLLNGFAYCEMIFEDDHPVDFVYLDVNASFERLTGLKNVVGKRVSEVIPGLKESDPELFERYGRVAKTGRPEQFETFVEGLGMWFEISVYCPRAGHFVAVFDVITERKTAQELVSAERNTLKTLIDTLPDRIYVKDRDRRFLLNNKAHLGALGCTSQEEALGKTDENFRPVEMAARSAADDRAVMESGQAMVNHEESNIRESGEEGWFLVTKVPLHDSHGVVTGLVGVSRNITKRKQTEVALVRSEEFHRSVIENAGGVPFRLVFGTTFGEGTYEYVGESISSLLGIDKKEFTERQFNSMIEEVRPVSQDIPADAVTCREEFRKGTISGYSADVRIRTATGEVRWINDSSVPLRDDKGIVIGAYGILIDITRRKQAELASQQLSNELRNALAWQEKIFEGSRDAVFVSDAGGRFVSANGAAMELTGYEREELLGMKIPDLHDEADLDAYKNFHGRIMAGEDLVTEAKIRRKNGAKVDTEFSNSRILIDGKSYLHTVARDITEKRKAEQTQRRLSSAVKQSHEIIFMTDLEGCITYVNPAFEQIYGFTQAEVLGKTPRILKSGVNSQSFYSSFWKQLLEGQNIRRELTNKTKDGRLITIEASVSPVRGLEGDITGFLSIQNDISDRVKVEGMLKEQAALLDNATDAISVVNLDGTLRYWNKGAERMFGYEAKETEGKDLWSIMGTGEKEMVDALSLTIMKNSYEGELIGLTRRGKSIVFQSRWTLLRDQNGKEKSILIVNSDVTERKELEKQFYRSQRLDSLGTLAGGIAHDLNNVLAPILLSFEILEKYVKNDQALKVLKTARESASRGRQIVSQVLTFARGAEGERGNIQIRHLLEEVASIARETFPKSIDVHVSSSKSLWTILADATQIHQVLMNLTVNARDAMPRGGDLTLSAENIELDEYFCRSQLRAQPGRYTVITVTDTGTGISRDQLDRIFDPFFTTKELGKGTGLGLSTVHAIVKSHAGFIDVSSTLGKGTSFRVYLPSSVDDAVIAQKQRQEVAPRGAGESILVVDDERSIREITEEVLVSQGYKVTTAADGVEAVALFAERAGAFDIVLTDIMMPVMDGTATIRALKRMKPSIKIIAMSGLASDESLLGTNETQPDAFLTKPFTSETLMGKIASLLNSAPVSGVLSTT